MTTHWARRSPEDLIGFQRSRSDDSGSDGEEQAPRDGDPQDAQREQEDARLEMISGVVYTALLPCVVRAGPGLTSVRRRPCRFPVWPFPFAEI